MKRLLFILIIFTTFSAHAVNGNGEMEIGSEAVLTNIKMLDVSGVEISLNDVKKEKGLLVMFSCNTCPFVMKWEERYSEVKKWADKHDVGMIVLNSNYGKRNNGDSYEDMKVRASDKGYNFYYAVDKDSKLANAFGGKTTPHAFLFDSDMKLVYKGALDDNYDNANRVKKAYVKDAIYSLAGGEEIEVVETKPVGCSIKRKLE